MDLLDWSLDYPMIDEDESARTRARLFLLALAAFLTGVSLYLAVRG
jgi:hypothetical protein